MTLFILAETSAGYALLQAQDKKLLKRDDLAAQTETAEGTCSLLNLRKFQKFDSATAALNEAAALAESKVTPVLSSLLDNIKDEKKVSLAVADPKLATAINKLPQLSIKPISDSTTSEIYRAIRTHLPSLIPGIMPEDFNTMSLGLSHSLSRHKLKFSPDKVDTMIIQAVGLLDDLDKELNTYAMRVKEWYGWHFPEMAKIINDNLAYARVILAVGMRTSASSTDLSDILPEEIETAVKAAAEVSMGTEITPDDLENIRLLAEQVVDFTEYRATLSSYLSSRMQAIAPNLTALVGDLVGARLIAHAGSLMNLAKSPGSTIQILGAEKALFRALKTKHDTPKYGLIYHASLIGQATGKNKGKIARMLAAKAALGLRVDALSDWGTSGDHKGVEPSEEDKAAVGIQGRQAAERKLRFLEGKPLRISGTQVGPSAGLVKGATQPGKWEIKEARKYNKDADGLMGDEPAANADDEEATAGAEVVMPKKSKEKKAKKEKKPKIVAEPDSDAESADEEDLVPPPTEKMDVEEEDEDEEEQPSKDERKAAKALRKAEKAAKKAAKEAKKAAKEDKKRKRTEGDADGEKKKKKKRKSEA